MNGAESNELETRRLLACLGDPSRFKLVGVLAAGGRCVGELAHMVGLSQSCTTRHLQALQRAGLVQGRREGRRVRFELRSGAPGLRELLDWALPPRGPEAADTPSPRAEAEGRRGQQSRVQPAGRAAGDPEREADAVEQPPDEAQLPRRFTQDLDDYLL